MISLQRQMTATLSDVGQGKAELKDYMMMWNLVFPIDRWWRSKHRIPFGSVAHGESSFHYMLAEYREDQLFNDISDTEEYIAGSGDIFKKVGREIAQEKAYDDWFDNMKI